MATCRISPVDQNNFWSFVFLLMLNNIFLLLFTQFFTIYLLWTFPPPKSCKRSTTLVIVKYVQCRCCHKTQMQLTQSRFFVKTRTLMIYCTSVLWGKTDLVLASSSEQILTLKCCNVNSGLKISNPLKPVNRWSWADKWLFITWKSCIKIIS